MAAFYQTFSKAVIALHSNIMKLKHQKLHIRPVHMLVAPVDLVTSSLLSELLAPTAVAVLQKQNLEM